MRKITLVLALVLSFMIPWEGVIRIPLLGSGVTVLGYLLSALWILTVLFTRQIRKPHPFHLALLLFVAWNAASIFWSKDPRRSLGHVMTWVQLLILAYIWWDLFSTQSRVLAGLQAYVLGAYVSVGGAIANYFSGYQFYTHYDRYSPGTTNPDGFGFIMALGIPVAWYLATSNMLSGKSRFWTVINYAFVPAAYLGIVLSGTRTALIASAVGMLYGFALLTQIRPWIRVVSVTVLISVSILLIPYVQNLQSFQRLGTTATELTQGDLNNRTNNWAEGLVAFVEHPAVGIGTYMYPTINTWNKAAHNTFLAILVELGLVGFALFAFILAIAIWEAWRLPRWESLFWITMLVVWSLGSFTLTWGHRKPTWLFLSLLIANAFLFIRKEVVLRLHANQPESGTISSTQPSAS